MSTRLSASSTMRRLAPLTTLLFVVASCSVADSGPSTTVAPSTTSTESIATTTLAPTTTVMSIEGLAGEPDLENLVREIYVDQEKTPDAAVASIGSTDESTRVAVVEAGGDVTLAVADPTWRIVGGWWPSIGRDTELGQFPKIIAVIGSDARPGHDPLGAQGDSIHFIGLDGNGTASVLGLPRDSYVPGPTGANMKMTSVLLRHGPDGLMETISNVTELEFDGYVLTGFAGFTTLIDVLGGLDIDVPVAMSDKWSQAYLDAGRQVLSAADALAFVRTRKTISGGDFTRKFHGGLALIAAARMVKGMGMSAVPGLMEASSDLYWTDLPAEDLLLVTAAIVKADLTEVTNIVAPGSVDTTSGGASIVRLRDSAYDLFADMADGHLEPPSE
ncbi:MAG: LCP family protein [Acidimicrobiia bacterium]